jgi:hypothetical protein
MTLKPLIDPQEITRAIAVITDPGQVVEIRALEAKLQGDYREGTVSGYFDNTTDLIQWVKKIQSAQGIYLTLNEPDPELIARAENRLRRLGPKEPTTANKEIKRLRWLPIDGDPNRWAGMSSTEEQHENALTQIQKVKDYLSSRGWPDPVESDSGNGAHLLYKIDLPTEDSDLIKSVLETLEKELELTGIKLDTSVYNPARIWKLYGTRACKGDDTQRRPHRMSHIIRVPETVEIVSRDLLEALIPPVEQEPIQLAPTRDFTRRTGLLSPVDFLNRHNIDYTDKGNNVFVLKNGCVFDENHKGNDAAVLIKPDGKWAYHCFHDGCGGKGWREFRLHFEPNAYDEPDVQPRKLEIVRSSTKRSYQPSKSDLAYNETTTNDSEVSEQEEKESQVRRLLRISQQASYFRGTDGSLYARVPVNGHHETLTINEVNSGLKRWLTYVFYKETNILPNKDLLSQAINAIVSIANYECSFASIHTRITEHEGCIYIDLANDQWECIKISKNGWDIIKNPPVFFRRSNGLLPLPTPVRGGSLEEIRTLINLATDEDYYLLVGWMLGTLHPRGPYPGLSLNGGQGTGKSFSTVTIKNILDPNIAPTKSSPKDERDMAIAAQNTHIICLDNLSSMPVWLSDLLCKLATGSGFSTRKLHTDDDEKIFYACRPFIINGIEDGLISRGDLLERSILVTLEPIDPSQRKTERELKKLVKDAHPRILGALLDAAVCALRELDNVDLPDLPRMADFCEWVTAAEPALGWEPRTFVNTFTDNQSNASSIAIEASPVAQAIKRYMGNCSKWEGMSQELYQSLQKYEDLTSKKTWPGNPRALSGVLKRVTPPLLSQGIKVFFHKRNSQGSKITISHVEQNVAKSADSVAKSADSVAKSADSVAKSADSVAKFSTPQPSNTQGLAHISVASVAKSDSLILSQIIQKNNNNDNQGKHSEDYSINNADFATFTTLATPQSVKENALRLLFQDFQRRLSGSTDKIRWDIPDSGFSLSLEDPKVILARVSSLINDGDHQTMTAVERFMRSYLEQGA